MRDWISKSLYTIEEPSMAQQFAGALKIRRRRGGGYMESDQTVVTWCTNHLVTMSYPEIYGMKFKYRGLQTLLLLPKGFKYEVITNVFKQFEIVKGPLSRPDIDTTHVCTDSGREGEYIYHLVAQMAGIKDKKQKRVWINSQTEGEILRGIREAKDEMECDNLSASTYLRAKGDYLTGTNLSRVLTPKYGPVLSNYSGAEFTIPSAGRVMTCVMEMVIRREQEIRGFVKTPFYRVIGSFEAPDKDDQPVPSGTEWKAVGDSRYLGTPYLYKGNDLRDRQQVRGLAALLTVEPSLTTTVLAKGRKREIKNPPLLYNPVELRSDCSKMSKVSSDETLGVMQGLYEKKVVAYPRADTRVLSTAVSKEVQRDIGGPKNHGSMVGSADEMLSMGSYRRIARTRYVSGKRITDHCTVVPTRQGFGDLRGLPPLSEKVHRVVYRQFLSIFYPPAVYQEYSLEPERLKKYFFANLKVLSEPGYLGVADVNLAKKSGVEESLDEARDETKDGTGDESRDETEEGAPNTISPKVDRTVLLQMLAESKKSDIPTLIELNIKENETSPPKRYTSGLMILAMENVSQLIEDEGLRAQIKGSGIDTSATRVEILKELSSIKYLSLNKKTQVITPSLLEGIVYDVTDQSIRQPLNPELTASWGKGLTHVVGGSTASDEYMEKLNHFVVGRTVDIIRINNQYSMRGYFDAAAAFYKTKKES